MRRTRTQLGETCNARDLVPGSPESLETTAHYLHAYGDTLVQAGKGLKRIDTEAGWRSKAGDAFRERFEGEPKRWVEAGDNFRDAAKALRDYISALRSAQQQAKEAIDRFECGEKASESAKRQHEGAMRNIKPSWSERKFPDFFVQWREEWKDPELCPENYLDFEGGLRFVLASAWLFSPETVEYRDCIFLKEHFDQETVDNWFSNLRGDRERIEAVTNQVNLWSVFTNTLAKHEPELGDEIPQLATALGECWQGVLSNRYPDQQINVQVSDEEDGTYGPTVTFWVSRVNADFG